MSDQQPKNPSADFAKSKATAQARLTQAKSFLTFAQYIRNHTSWSRRASDPLPSADDKADQAALKKQWQDLLSGDLPGLNSASEFLAKEFMQEVEKASRQAYLADLDGVQGAEDAGVAWQEVKETVECMKVRREVDALFAR